MIADWRVPNVYALRVAWVGSLRASFALFCQLRCAPCFSSSALSKYSANHLQLTGTLPRSGGYRHNHSCQGSAPVVSRRRLSATVLFEGSATDLVRPSPDKHT